jgi:glycosyltransferase involved in cell wall biosynthesis
MSDQPLVSIIIPTYNRAHLIGETLDSLVAQTYLNWECIIVDDGSSDNTDEVIGEHVNKDSRFKYYHRPEVHLPGGNGARNYGFKMSKGEYVNWFSSDDLMVAEKLEVKVKAMLENEVDFMVGGNAEIISLDPYVVKKPVVYF